LTGNINGLRVGLVKEGFNADNEPDVNKMVKKSAERLRDIGAIVDEVSVPWHNKGIGKTTKLRGLSGTLNSESYFSINVIDALSFE